MDEFFRGALEKVEGIEETSMQGILALRVGKFEVEQAAMTFNDGQTVEFASRVAIGEGTKMAPLCRYPDYAE
jgi:hypothetical protein